MLETISGVLDISLPLAVVLLAVSSLASDSEENNSDRVDSADFGPEFTTEHGICISYFGPLQHLNLGKLLFLR